MIRVLEAVPNFSEGRDLEWVRAVVGRISDQGAEVIDWSADPDHNRSVVTILGAPEIVENAAVAAARFATETLDLTSHRGVHPRIGAIDVLPFVPLQGVDMTDAIACAHRVGRRVVEFGLPVFYYGAASEPPGRGLGALRRGGFEGLGERMAEGVLPDLAPNDRTAAPHPTAGCVCIGAREVLLAWNVFIEGISIEEAKAIAGEIRESGGGFRHLRALAFQLAEADRLQISMNLEAPDVTSPFAVFDAILDRVEGRGGRVTGTEVIGMMPDALVLQPGKARLELLDSSPDRILSRRVQHHVARRLEANPGAISRVDSSTADGGE